MLSFCPGVLATIFPCPVGPERLDLPDSLASVTMETLGQLSTPLISYQCLIETLTRGGREQTPRNGSATAGQERWLGLKGRIKHGFLFPGEQASFCVSKTVLYDAMVCVSVWLRFCSVFDFTGRGLNMKANLLGVSMATTKQSCLFFSFLRFHLALSRNVTKNKIKNI